MFDLQDPRTCQISLGSPYSYVKRTQTLKLRFLYVTDSTLNPMVGIVVTTSPIYCACQHARLETRLSMSKTLKALALWKRPRTFSLYNKVVLPALSCICHQHPSFNSSSSLGFSYKAQNKYSCLLLCPDQPRKLGDIAAHDVSFAVFAPVSSCCRACSRRGKLCRSRKEGCVLSIHSKEFGGRGGGGQVNIERSGGLRVVCQDSAAGWPES